ncbi:hypothetical protein AAE478_000823 [Parahypoxylon ruwenzoriense]
MCCGSSDDYYDHPHSQVQAQPRSPGPTKRQRQAVASLAAYDYGWQRMQYPELQRPGNRDSQIEYELAYAMAGLPGNYSADSGAMRSSEYSRQPSQPGRRQQSHQQKQQHQSPNLRNDFHRRGAPIPPPGGMPGRTQQRTAHNGRGEVISQQPNMREAMSEVKIQNVKLPRYPEIVHQPPYRPRLPRKAVIGTIPEPVPLKPSPAYPAKLVRRDSKGVSEFGSDDEDDDSLWRTHSVSSAASGQSSRERVNLYAHTGHDYGRHGAF